MINATSSRKRQFDRALKGRQQVLRCAPEAAFIAGSSGHPARRLES